jgi:hypothetical protein
MWIIQEVVLSPRGDVICGGEEIDWKKFCIAARAINDNIWLPLSDRKSLERIVKLADLQKDLLGESAGRDEPSASSYLRSREHPYSGHLRYLLQDVAEA